MLKEGAICHPDRVLLVGANSLGTVPPRLFFLIAPPTSMPVAALLVASESRAGTSAGATIAASPRSSRSFDGHSFAEKIRNVTKVKSLLFANVGERALQCCLC